VSIFIFSHENWIEEASKEHGYMYVKWWFNRFLSQSDASREIVLVYFSYTVYLLLQLLYVKS